VRVRVRMRVRVRVRVKVRVRVRMRVRVRVRVTVVGPKAASASFCLRLVTSARIASTHSLASDSDAAI
jgi:hypothetical protein